eukprot:1161821-Pelagomonas_calceolata.AAC.20
MPTSGGIYSSCICSQLAGLPLDFEGRLHVSNLPVQVKTSKESRCHVPVASWYGFQCQASCSNGKGEKNDALLFYVFGQQSGCAGVCNHLRLVHMHANRAAMKIQVLLHARNAI